MALVFQWPAKTGPFLRLLLVETGTSRQRPFFFRVLEDQGGSAPLRKWSESPNPGIHQHEAAVLRVLIGLEPGDDLDLNGKQPFHHQTTRLQRTPPPPRIFKSTGFRSPDPSSSARSKRCSERRCEASGGASAAHPLRFLESPLQKR